MSTKFKRIKVKAAVRRFERMDRTLDRIVAKMDHNIKHETSERLYQAATKIFDLWQQELADAPDELITALRARGLIEPVYMGSKQ
jgi:exonuclease VII small subunit